MRRQQQQDEPELANCLHASSHRIAEIEVRIHRIPMKTSAHADGLLVTTGKAQGSPQGPSPCRLLVAGPAFLSVTAMTEQSLNQE
jgi:hypothetical protein